MAGGNAGDIRSPWPKGRDGWLLLTFGPFDIAASKSSDHKVDALTVPFACRARDAEFVASVLAESNGITVNVEDDSSTPKVVIDDGGVAAITDGAAAPQALTVDSSQLLYAGAVLTASYKSGASDTATNAKIRLWVEPIH